MRIALDLDLWGERVRVLAEAPEVGKALQRVTATHVTSEPAPVAFVLKAPSRSGGLHHLIDRSGLVLARTRRWEETLAVLVEHLATFAPPPPDTVRTSFRAVIRGHGPSRTAALASFPLLAIPPIVERQLERRSQRVVDRLMVDITREGVIDISPLPWPELRSLEPTGHTGSDATGTPVSTLLVGAGIDVLPRAQLICSIAARIHNATPTMALDLAERLGEGARTVPIGDKSSLRSALEM